MEGLKERGDEAFDREDMPLCLTLRQELVADTLAAAESSVREKVDAHVLLARVYGTSPHYEKERNKQFELAVEIAAAADDVALICQVLTKLAGVLFRAMEPDAALSQFQRAIKLGQEIKERDSEPYFRALIEFGRVTLNINAEGGQEKALKALLEAVEGSKALGEYTELHALALSALAECKKASEDYDETIELIDKALTTEKLSEFDQARALTFQGTAYSEKEGGTQRALECYSKAMDIRARIHANGREHYSVAEVLIDVAAEYHELGQGIKVCESLENAIPYLNLPDQVIDVQWAWLKKSLQDLGDLSSDEVRERYQKTKKRRKDSQRTRKRLPAPKTEGQASFLPINLAPKKKKNNQGKNKKK